MNHVLEICFLQNNQKLPLRKLEQQCIFSVRIKNVAEILFGTFLTANAKWDHVSSLADVSQYSRAMFGWHSWIIILLRGFAAKARIGHAIWSTCQLSIQRTSAERTTAESEYRRVENILIICY